MPIFGSVFSEKENADIAAYMIAPAEFANPAERPMAIPKRGEKRGF